MPLLFINNDLTSSADIPVFVDSVLNLFFKHEIILPLTGLSPEP